MSFFGCSDRIPGDRPVSGCSDLRNLLNTSRNDNTRGKGKGKGGIGYASYLGWGEIWVKYNFRSKLGNKTGEERGLICASPYPLVDHPIAFGVSFLTHSVRVGDS